MDRCSKSLFRQESDKFVAENGSNITLIELLIKYCSHKNLEKCRIDFTPHGTDGLFYVGKDYICELNSVFNLESIKEEFNRCREWIDNYCERNSAGLIKMPNLFQRIWGEIKRSFKIKSKSKLKDKKIDIKNIGIKKSSEIINLEENTES